MRMDRNGERARSALREFPDAADTLERREYAVLRMRATGPTYEEMAEEFGVTRERVRQLEYAAIKRLRTQAGPNTPEHLYRHERFGSDAAYIEAWLR